ncbi:uncharacterized protein SCHCODRAFT_02627908 [Schizophyllum commune H4-8]|uniref:uncharacterized protein n=1 Tax=Schizophyllum commune (strain H4-8 / FGSC 9210) TaxID=578458 RepID=UPI00215F2E4A|nr:uncharacterized protein SCHCODRAFT_02627908 [Schizophyllum commune H4-8]KAI5891019.1 hypothetical protein SCHCODRAFT_02627908 [Schizophyllum commune H4-8]
MATYFGALPYTPFSGIPNETYASRERVTGYVSQTHSSFSSPALSEGDPTPPREASPIGEAVYEQTHSSAYEQTRPLVRQDSLPSRFARKDRSFYEENVSQESAPVPSIFDMLVTAAAAEELDADASVGPDEAQNMPRVMESASAATTYAPYNDGHATADVDNNAMVDVDSHPMVDNDTDVAMLSESDAEDTEDEDFAMIESEDDDEDDEYEEPARKRARRSPVAKKSAPAKRTSASAKVASTNKSTPTKKSTPTRTSTPTKKDSPPKTSASARTSPRAKTSSASATTPSTSPKTSPRAKKSPSPVNASASAKNPSASAKNPSASSKKTTTPPKKRASRSKKGSPSTSTTPSTSSTPSATTVDADADAEMSYDEMVANIGSVKTLPWTTEGVKAFVVSFIKRSDARRAAVKRKAEEAKQKKIEEAAKKAEEAAEAGEGQEGVVEGQKAQGKKAGGKKASAPTPAPTTTGKRKRGPVIEDIDEDDDLDEYEIDDGDDCNCHASTSTSTLPCTCGPSSKKTCHALSQRIELMRTDPTLTSFGAHHAMCAGCGTQIRTDIRWEFYFKALWGKHSLEKCAGLRKWEESPPSAEQMEEWQKSRDASAEDAVSRCFDAIIDRANVLTRPIESLLHDDGGQGHVEVRVQGAGPRGRDHQEVRGG